MTETNGDAALLPERLDGRIHPDWCLDDWAGRLLDEAGVGVTILDRSGVVLYYNKWASEHLDRRPEYIGGDVRERHRRAVTNPRFNAMLGLFENGRTEPVRYVARPYGKTTILVTVSPIRVQGELVGFSQIVLLKDEVQDLCRRFDESGRESFERDVLPDGRGRTSSPVAPAQ
ncbi:PAS domain-containing protein [Nocardiopsis sediminis]|uniref:PAS domain-containing protein n=1 Tax=Nocardiopsis sediminis TaxID=1778267 RepID=A0ABV8FSQ0_9ACTN